MEKFKFDISNSTANNFALICDAFMITKFILTFPDIFPVQKIGVQEIFKHLGHDPQFIFQPAFLFDILNYYLSKIFTYFKFSAKETSQLERWF